MRHALTLITTLLLAPLAALTAAETTPTQAPTHLACIGDSITAGFGATPRPTMSYPAQLGRMLGPGWVVGNFGVSSGTLMDTPASKRVWSKFAMAKVVKFGPDVVIINLGINDCQPQVWVQKADFLPVYRSLLAELRALPSKPKIFLCRPTPPSHKKFDTTRWIGLKELLPMMDQLAKEENLPLVDFQEPLTGHEDLFPDGLHPNNAGAEIMARTAYRALLGKPFEGAVPPPPPQAEKPAPTPKPVATPTPTPQPTP